MSKVADGSDDGTAQHRIQELKRQALVAKQAGNVAEALAFLDQARHLQFATITDPSHMTDPIKLQQLAIYWKQQGNLVKAKQALLRSKQLKLEQQQLQQQQQQPSVVDVPAPIVASTVGVPLQQTESQTPATPASALQSYTTPSNGGGGDGGGAFYKENKVAEPPTDSGALPSQVIPSPPPPPPPPPPSYELAEKQQATTVSASSPPPPPPPPPPSYEAMVHGAQEDPVSPSSSTWERTTSGAEEEGRSPISEAKASQPSMANSLSSATSSPQSTTNTSERNQGMDQSTPEQPPGDDSSSGRRGNHSSRIDDQVPPPPPTAAAAAAAGALMSDDALEAMMHKEEESDEVEGVAAAAAAAATASAPDAPPTFTDAEWMDLEMMTEFALGGFAIPSLADYQHKISNAKLDALTAKKTGDTATALQHLKTMKQFQAVHDGLAALPHLDELRSSDDDHQWLEELTAEDNELIRELFTDSNVQLEQQVAQSQTLELVDMADMDAGTLRDAMELGMTLPDMEEVQIEANDKKTLAVRLKREGDLEGAKAALVAFKTMTQQATKLKALLQSFKIRSNNSGNIVSTDNNDDDDDDDAPPTAEVNVDDLEALLQESERPRTKPASTTAPAAPKPKTSNELRQEAIQLRDEKKIAEATQVLKLYKQALARESHAAELAGQKKLMSDLQGEVTKAQLQHARFLIYQRLVDVPSAVTQLDTWARYADTCAKVAMMIDTKGTAAVTICRKPSPSLRVLPDDLTNVVEQATDPMEERLEITILGVEQLTSNKSFATMPLTSDTSRLQIHVSIQLPFSEQEMDKPIDLYFESSTDLVALKERKADEGSTVSSTGISFDSRVQYVTLPRGDSKFAKTFLRRMERRKITITLNHVVVSTKAMKSSGGGWFGGGRKNGLAVTDTNSVALSSFGKVVLETKDLLSCSCILGTYPLLGNGKRQLGGSLSICFRTGTPFDPSKVVTAPQTIDTSSLLSTIPIYEQAMSFAINKESDKES